MKGLFHDEKGLYECENYIYEGSFSEGKKHGYGSFKEKQKGNTQKKKLSLPLTLVGNWEKDIFIG